MATGFAIDREVNERGAFWKPVYRVGPKFHREINIENGSNDRSTIGI